jgi:DNA gyrase subunit A
MSALRHVDVEANRREEYLRAVNARRRLTGSDYSERPEKRQEDEILAAKLEMPEFREMAEKEQFLLTVAEDGYGKRTSSYEYRITGRDGSGIAALDLGRAHGMSTAVAAFPLLPNDQIVMVTDAGQLIRCPVDGISINGRTTRGVKVFTTAEGERVVSVSRIRDVEEGGGESPAAGRVSDDDREAEDGVSDAEGQQGEGDS